MTAWHDARMIDTFAQSDTQASVHSTFLPAKNWLIEGLRAGFFLPPRTAGRSPAPLQVLLIFIACLALKVALSRLAFVGPARFDTQAPRQSGHPQPRDRRVGLLFWRLVCAAGQ